MLLQKLGRVGITRPTGVSEGIAGAGDPGAEWTAAHSAAAVPGFSWPVRRPAPATERCQPFVNVWQLLQSSFLSVTCFSWMVVNDAVFALWHDAQSGLPLRMDSGV